MSSLLSLSDLSRSSVPLIWELCNENFGCFSKEYSSIFYRELMSIQIPDPDAGQGEWVQFSDYFERKTGQPYEMGNSPDRPEINKIFDSVFGVGAALRATSSIDQSSMQFFITYFLEELSSRNKGAGLILEKKNLVQIDSEESGKLRLKVKFDLQRAQDPFSALSIPFEVKFEADFEILDSGVQLRHLLLSGPQAEFAKRLLMGAGTNFTLLERVELNCKGSSPVAEADPLMALVMVSPLAAIGLCEAIAMGADIASIRELARMTDLNMYKFLGVIGTFVSGGSLEALLDMGSSSLFERQKLKRKLPEIKAKFQDQLALMQSLCQGEALDSGSASGSGSGSESGSSTPVSISSEELFGGGSSADSPLPIPSESGAGAGSGFFKSLRRESVLRISPLSRFNRRHSAPPTFSPSDDSIGGDFVRTSEKGGKVEKPEKPEGENSSPDTISYRFRFPSSPVS
jgi:hypothetical protein